VKRLLRGWTDRVLDRIAVPYLFQLYRRERLARQEFFYDAFKALRFNGIDGDYAEFGSWGGLTFGLAYGESRRHGHPAKLWAFDSFQGLPQPRGAEDEHPEWRRGKMATNVDEFHAICAANGIPRDAYELVPGFYEDTLPSRAPDEEPSNIALAYVDCDLYTSAKTVLEFLRPRLKHGMIVAFDDYFCWSATQVSGERRAWLELSAADSTWEWVPYVQFGWHGQSMVLERRVS
jgi:O-methyltransferase